MPSAFDVPICHRIPPRPLHSVPAFIVACVITWLLCATAGSAQDPQWEALRDGLGITLWRPEAVCQDVPPLLMVRIDPERFQFAVYHYQDEGLPGPLTIQEWQQRTGMPLLFNAGLFREDFSYLGLLLKGGRLLAGKRHHLWQGLFVAEPVEPGLRKARVLDLTVDTFHEAQPAYREAAQSLMLFDRTGKPRVRASAKRAYQTVVAEDAEGRIVVIKTTDVVSLYELAQCLQEGVSHLRQAMAMDGGSSSDFLLGSDLLRRVEGSSPWQAYVDGTATRHIPLPAVIGATRRTDSTQGKADSRKSRLGPDR